MHLIFFAYKSLKPLKA